MQDAPSFSICLYFLSRRLPGVSSHGSPGVGEPTSGALVKQVEKRAIREGVAVFAQPQME